MVQVASVIQISSPIENGFDSLTVRYNAKPFIASTLLSLKTLLNLFSK